MSARFRGSRWSGVVAVCVVVAASAPLRAQPSDPVKTSCIQAFEGSQENRKAQALRAAHQQLLVCASDACPPIVRTDCIRWLAEVEAETPSIVLEAKGPSGPVFDVTVRLDGTPLVTQLDGRPIEIDPGLHTLTFERAGFPTLEQKVIVRESERNRLVAVDWAPPAAPPSPEAPAPVAMARPVPASVYVVLGIAALGFVDFAVAGSLGLAKKQDLERAPSCAPFCAARDVDYVKTTYAIADVGLAVGVAGVITSGILFLTRPERPVAPRSVPGIVIQPRAAGALVGWSGTF